MLIYLDVSCLNRPFDDQTQPRIRLEAEAITVILEMIDRAEARQAASEIAEIEVDAMPDLERRRRVRALMLPDADRMRLSPAVFERGEELERLAFKAADALHIASAESLSADVFLTCDDRLLKSAERHASRLKVQVANPLTWLKERRRETNAQ